MLKIVSMRCLIIIASIILPAVFLIISIGLAGTYNAERISLGSEVVTGWDAFTPNIWKADLHVAPKNIKSNEVLLANGCAEDFLVDGEWFWTGSILYINDAQGNPDTTGKTITAQFHDQEPIIVTGWTNSPPVVWQSNLATSPVHVLVNNTWYSDWWWGPLDNCDATETGETNTLYMRDADGNPDNTGKTIAAVTKSGGWSVTSGDFNGDGLSDVVHSNHGEVVYINYGNNAFSTIPDKTLSDPEGASKFGFYVASAGDLNRDGFDELVVTMNWGDNKVYLYMGAPQGLSDTPTTILYPPENYREYGFGHGISRGGDINGDGFSDILIGSGSGIPTYFCAYLGSPSGINAAPDQIISYPGTGGTISLSIIGDINNDGFDEIAVSVSKTPPASDFEVYVYRGSSSGINPNPQLITISIPNGTTYRVGNIAPAGDLNGDGFADLLIGNQWADGNYLREGKAYVFYGSNSRFSNSADVVIDNPNPEYNVRFGKSADGIGDFNHDGFDDIVVGCPYGNFASIYYGSLGGVSTVPSHILSGIDWLGWSASRVGDIKGNGQNYIVVGEEFGTAYLFAHKKTEIIPMLMLLLLE